MGKLREKTCFQNKSKFITKNYFVQHMNITVNKVYLNGKLYPKDNEGTSLIKRVSLIEGSSICKFNLQSFACAN